MYLINVISFAIDQANEIVDAERNSNTSNKYKYHVNVNQAVASFKDDFILDCPDSNRRRASRKVTQILIEISNSVVPIRPDRSVPRLTNPRKAKHHHNHKSNS